MWFCVIAEPHPAPLKVFQPRMQSMRPCPRGGKLKKQTSDQKRRFFGSRGGAGSRVEEGRRVEVEGREEEEVDTKGCAQVSPMVQMIMKRTF